MGPLNLYGNFQFIVLSYNCSRARQETETKFIFIFASEKNHILSTRESLRSKLRFALNAIK